MAAYSEVVYGPHARVRLIPSAFAICLALAIGTFCVAWFDVNGMREQSGYAPPLLFLAFAAVFLVLFRQKMVRVVLGPEGVTIERLVPPRGRPGFAAYSEIAEIRQRKMSLKLELVDRQGNVLMILPETIEKVSGTLTQVTKSSIPDTAQGLILELYGLRQEIAVRAHLYQDKQ